MKYLIIDGMLNGTGVRDAVNGGYINLIDLEISKDLAKKIENWQKRYEQEYYLGYENSKIVMDLDKEGIQLSKLLKEELDSKVDYYSDAQMKLFI